MLRRRPPFRVIVFVVVTLFLHQSPRYCCRAVRNLRIASPLQALTIWDHHNDDDGGDNGDDEEGLTRQRKTTATATATTTARGRYLPKCKAGARAESRARKELQDRQTQLLQARAAATATTGDGDKGWAQRARAADERLSIAQNAVLEKAYDAAVAQVAGAASSSSTTTTSPTKKENDPNQYQFVGVIRPLSSDKKQQKDKDSSSTDEPSPPITWYARKKPANAKWSVRLVHANRPALIQDLFRRGKIDIVAKYENAGIKRSTNPEATDNTRDDDYVPQVTGKYTVRERTWKNLWNFRPQNVFKDPSGMYWRERRLSPGLYTDGRNVYEASYRYRDGRNGMHRVSTLQRYLDSPAVDKSQKERIVQRLSGSAPDVVLEE